MFVLEESQLLEDTIRDPQVLEVYRLLRHNEHSNDRCLFRDRILSSPICSRFLEVMLDTAQANSIPVSEGTSFEIPHKIPAEQRAEMSSKLELEPSEIAPLALVISATLTQLFVIDNFVGPRNAHGETNSSNPPHILDKLANMINCRALSVDASDVYHRIRNPWLLKCAQLCWTILANLGISRRLLELEFLVWKQRYLTVHLMIFLEPPESCVKELKKLHEFIFDHHIINNDIKQNKTQITRFDTVELCCELVQSSLLFDAITTARKICDFVSEHSGITIEHTGVLGKRTKFQQDNIPQLVVKVQGSTIEEVLPQENNLQLPKDVKLEDDTLLPEISFVSSDGLKTSGMTKNLGIHAQLFMQARLDLALKSEVMEESLKDEWTLAYLRSTIEGASLWALKYKTLHQRSMVEKKNMRKMDRALLQLEELMNSSSKSVGPSSRMRCFYSVLPLVEWQMQKSLADISLDMGLAKNALDLYSQMEFYEGMIKCLCLMEQTTKAEKLIRQELQKQESSYLYCLLGDVTEDITHYETSWLLSKKRFARAKKSIGTHYYVRKQYTEAIENYEAALSASPSNISILSILAYCCLTLEQYERAAEYYRRLTYLDDTSFLAWNNLSKAYIKLNQKERAWRTLREAIKCNYDEWRIWENFMVVSIELGAIDDVVTAWHRIIDIKSSHKDDRVLSGLTYAMVKKESKKNDSSHMKLLNECIKLVARLISTSGCSPRTWLCYFRLLIKELDQLKTITGERELSQLDLDSRVSKITNCLQRATPNATTADSELLQDSERVHKLLDTYDEIVDCYGSALDVVGHREELRKQWNYFKLSATNFLKALEKKGYRPAGN